MKEFERALNEAVRGFREEERHVDALLKECGRTKTAPGKEYWHKLRELEGRVKLLRKLAE